MTREVIRNTVDLRIWDRVGGPHGKSEQVSKLESWLSEDQRTSKIRVTLHCGCSALLAADDPHRMLIAGRGRGGTPYTWDRDNCKHASRAL